MGENEDLMSQATREFMQGQGFADKEADVVVADPPAETIFEPVI
jgi:hypothetical protein